MFNTMFGRFMGCLVFIIAIVVAVLYFTKFEPTSLWWTLLGLSGLFSIVIAIARTIKIGMGIGEIADFAMLVICFIKLGWKGALALVAFQLLFMAITEGLRTISRKPTY